MPRDGKASLWGRVARKTRPGREDAGGDPDGAKPSEASSKPAAAGPRVAAKPPRTGLFGALRRTAKHPADESTAPTGPGGAAAQAQESSLSSSSGSSIASPPNADGSKAQRGLHKSALSSGGWRGMRSNNNNNREHKGKKQRSDAEGGPQRSSLSFGGWNTKRNKPKVGMQQQGGQQQQQKQQEQQKQKGQQQEEEEEEEGRVPVETHDVKSVAYESPTSAATSAERKETGVIPALQPSGEAEGEAEGDAPTFSDTDSDDDEFFDAMSHASWEETEDEDEGPGVQRDNNEEQSASRSGMTTTTTTTTTTREAPLDEAAGAAAAAERGSAVAVDPSDLRAHRAAFEGDTRGVVAAVKGDAGQLVVTDTHGNTALHVASIRGHLGAAQALVAAGARVEQKNGRGWSALDEAISLRDRQMVAVLYKHRMGELKSVYKAKKAEFIENLDGMVDFKLQMSWELGSNYFGYLLRKVAPNDTYDVYKFGNRIRVDGTLMGVEDKAKSLIPEWKRSHFSVLFLPPGAPGTAGADKSKIVLVNRVKNEWIDLSDSKKEQQRMAGATGASAESREVSVLMREGAGKTKMKTSELKFKPVKTWTGGVYKEKVWGWNTTVYEAQARLVAITTYKTPVELPEECSFEEYLALEVPEDIVKERPVDPLSMESFKKGGGKGGSTTTKASGAEENNDDEAAKKPQPPPRKVTSRLWMAHDFPLSLHELLPVLDIIGHANKHIQKVAGFMSKYGDRELFPVKVQVPLMMTVFALVSFKGFTRLEKNKSSSSGSPQPETEASFYEMPPGCTKTTPEKMFGLPQRRGGAKRRDPAAVSDPSISGTDVGSLRADPEDGDGGVIVNHGDPDLESWEASLHYSEPS